MIKKRKNRSLHKPKARKKARVLHLKKRKRIKARKVTTRKIRTKKIKKEDLTSETIFDSRSGNTDALFVNIPQDKDIMEALKEFDTLEKNKSEITKEIPAADIQPLLKAEPVLPELPEAQQEQKKKKSFWKKLFSLNNRLFSILIGLIFAGMLCAGVYVLAALSPYTPPAPLEPGCSPTDSGCSVKPPLTDNFTTDFSGSGNITTSAAITGGILKVDSAYTLPTSDGLSGYVLTTDGLGNVTWEVGGGGGGGGSSLLLDQTTPQTVTNGVPTFASGLNVGLSTLGTPVSFTQGVGGTTDIISGNLHITRATHHLIYNSVVESDGDHNASGTDLTSPLGTEWNADGFSDLSDYRTRTYDTLDSMTGSNPPDLVGMDLIMHDIPDDRYFEVVFSFWGESGAGGFAYTRTEILSRDLNVHGNTNIYGNITLGVPGDVTLKTDGSGNLLVNGGITLGSTGDVALTTDGGGGLLSNGNPFTNFWTESSGVLSPANSSDLIALFGGTASGTQTMSIGYNTIASGDYSTAIGYQSQSTGDYSIALGGDFAVATGGDAVAIGTATVANGGASTAIGNHATANGNNSTAIGYFTTAGGDYQTAIGKYDIPNGSAGDSGIGDYAFIIGNGTPFVSSNGLTVDWDGNLTIAGGLTLGSLGDVALTSDGSGNLLVNGSPIGGGGFWTESAGVLSPTNSSDALSIMSGAISGGALIAFGPSSSASDIYSTAIGAGTTASGYDSTAIGQSATASGYESTAMGITATASAQYSMALGYQTTASGYASTAIGYRPTASGQGALSMGDQSIASGDFSTAMGNSTIASGDIQTVIGQYNISNGTEGDGGPGSGDYSFIIGNGTDSSHLSNAITVDWAGNLTIAGGMTLGSLADVTLTSDGSGNLLVNGSPIGGGGFWTESAGVLSPTVSTDSIAVGPSATASGNYSAAIGENSTASGSNGTAIGYHTTASGTYSTAIGAITTASGEISTAMGWGTTAQGYGQTVIGINNIVSGNSSVWTPTDYAFIIGNDASFSSPSNAFTVDWLGNTHIMGNLVVDGSIDPTFIEYTQISAPLNPAPGKDRLYFKSDDNLYKLTSAGVETEVGAGGGGGLLTSAFGTLYPTTTTNRFLIGGATDNGTAALQVKALSGYSCTDSNCSDQSSCEATPLQCASTWNPSGSCDQYGCTDQSSCEAGWDGNCGSTWNPAGNCSGNYDTGNGSCDGTYESGGTCSGNYDAGSGNGTCSGPSDYYGTCSGTYVGGDCSDFNNDNPSCSSYPGDCTWTSGDCADWNNDSSSCSSYSCTWTPAIDGDCSDFNGDSTGCSSHSTSPETCVWTPGDCNDFNLSDYGSTCSGYPGECTWTPAMDGDCNSAFTDESSCNGTSGCTWNDTSSCNDSNCGDQTSCESPVSTCGGTWSDTPYCDNSNCTDQASCEATPIQCASTWVAGGYAGYAINATGNVNITGFLSAAGGTASGGGSIAVGSGSVANGSNSSVAIGYSTIASGSSSTATGANTTASGGYATAMGYNTNATGLYSTAIGASTTASGLDSMAMGFGTHAGGYYSTTMGYTTRAYGDFQTVIGKYNIPNGTGGDGGVGDYAFIIGNGTSSGSSNALTVDWSGNLTAAGTLTAGTIKVGSAYTLPTSDGSAGYVLSTDGSGHVTWQSASLVADVPYTGAINNVNLGSHDLTTTGKGTFGTFNMPTNASLGYVLTSDAFGNGTWAALGAWNSKAYPTNASGVLTNDGSGNLSWTAPNYLWTLTSGVLTPQSNKLALGAGSIVTGVDGTAMGALTTASGQNSTSLGANTTASGNNSTAMGSNTVAQGYSQTVIGSYNIPSGTPNSIVNTDYLFIIGNGRAPSTYSNALTVDWLGNTTIGNQLKILDGSGNYHTTIQGGTQSYEITYTLPTVQGAASTFLQNNGSGNLSWASFSGVPYTGATSNVNLGAHNLSTTGAIIAGKLQVGPGASATGLSSDAIGDHTTASGDNSIAIGYYATASGYNSVAIGDHVTASGEGGTAIGYQTRASGLYSTAMGSITTASAVGTTAMGASTTASAQAATAMGIATLASGWQSLAAGDYTIAQGYDQTVIGEANVASGTGTSRVNSDYAFIIGNGADFAHRSNALTVDWLGNLATAGGITTGTDVAGGSPNVAGSLKLWSAGDNAYSTTFTAGTQTGDVSYVLPAAQGAASTFLQNDGSGNLSWASAGGGFFAAGSSGTNSMVQTGAGNTATQDNSIAMGYHSTASALNSVAIGYYATASGADAFAAGGSSTASATDSVAAGSSALADGIYSTALSRGHSSGDTSFAAGTGYAQGDHTTAIGTGVWAKAYGQTTIGMYNITQGASRYSRTDTDYAFVIGNGTYDDMTYETTYSNALTVDWLGNLTVASSLILTPLGSAPASPTNGQLYFDSSAGLEVYNGGWQTINTTSSLRYKHDVQPLTDNWSKILQVEPKSFVYNGHPDSETNIGYIAEDFDTLGLKDLVQYDNKGRPNGINYDKISLYNTEIIKQQQIDINALKQKLGMPVDGSVEINPAGTSGNGSVTGVTDQSVQSALAKLGATLSGGIMSLKEIIADKVDVGEMQMTDKSTGDKYCIWIENGDWKKAKGDCSSITSSSTTETIASPASAQQTQAAISMAQQAAKSAQQATEQAQQAQESVQQIQEQVQQQLQFANIVLVATLADINVSPGTDLYAANLPTTVDVTLSDGTTVALAVTWDNGNPAYDSSKLGTYVFTGTLTVPENVTNTNDIKATVSVVVEEQPLDPVNATAQLIHSFASSLTNIVLKFFSWIFGSGIKAAAGLISH